MLPVRNFISLATVRSGSMGMSPLVTRLMALEAMCEATETAAPHADGLLDEPW